MKSLITGSGTNTIAIEDDPAGASVGFRAVGYFEGSSIIFDSLDPTPGSTNRWFLSIGLDHQHYFYY